MFFLHWLTFKTYFGNVVKPNCYQGKNDILNLGTVQKVLPQKQECEIGCSKELKAAMIFIIRPVGPQYIHRGWWGIRWTVSASSQLPWYGAPPDILSDHPLGTRSLWCLAQLVHLEGKERQRKPFYQGQILHWVLRPVLFTLESKLSNPGQNLKMGAFLAKAKLLFAPKIPLLPNIHTAKYNFLEI